MKKLILLLTIASSFSAFAQNCRQDTIFQYSVNVNDVRTPTVKTINEFNAANFITKETKQNWVNNAWVNYQETSTTYNTINKKTLTLVKRWVNNAWENYTKTEFAYHTSNKEMENNSYNWNNSNNTWMPNQSYVRTYDANGNELSLTHKIGYLNEWRNNTQSMSEVDANGNATLVTNLKWNLGTFEWDKQNQTARTYNTSNKKLTEEQRNWNGSNSTFVPTSIWTYSYNSDQILTEELLQNWNGNSFINNFKTLYVYNADKNLITKTTQRYFAEWKTTNKVIYVYNSNKLLTTELYSEFNLNTNTEIPTNKSEFTYNTNGDRTSTDYSNWNGTSYITGQRINYTFNSNNQLTDVLTLLFNQLIMNLLPLTKETYEYDANGLRTAYEIRQNFSIDLSKYQTGARTEYRCTNVATTSLISKSTNKIKIYPNPATTFLNIEGLKINSTIQILNAKGKVILSKVIEDENTTIDVSELSNGIYFINSNINFVSTKLMIQR